MAGVSLEDALGDGPATDVPEVKPDDNPTEQEATTDAEHADGSSENAAATTDGEATAEPDKEAKAEPGTEGDKPHDPETGRASGTMPYAAYATEKSKRKEAVDRAEAAERELVELRARNASSQQPVQPHPQPQRQPPRVVDVLQDPEGFAHDLSSQFENMRTQTKMDLSERFTVKEHGSEAVQAAQAALRAKEQQTPGFIAQFLRTQDPYGEIVKWHQHEQAVETIGDPAEFEKNLRQTIIAEMKAAPAETPNAQSQPAPALPTDLSGTPNVGGRSASNWSGPTNLEDALK